ncbi:translational activator of GCN4 [Entomophthora muscae]|nr:translational activator of GCN4 [Entomophthora muscae]
MVLPPLLKSCNQSDAAAEEAVRATLEALLAQVDNSGLELLLEIFLDWIQSDSNESRAEGCAAMAMFFRVAQDGLEILPHVVDWIRILIPLYRAPFEPLMRNAGLAFSGLIKCLDKSDLDQLVIPLRQAVKNTIKGMPQDQDLPGFCQPKAIAPFLSVYLQGLMFSSSDVRERSASSLGEVVARTNFDALKPFVTQITGPLIRIIGERYPAPVKVSILDTLFVLFGRAGSAMRPFLPQLQRTYIKSLGDVNSAEVRARAEKGLAVLIELLPRVDPLCTELVAGCRSAEETDIRQGFLRVLLLVVTAMADKLTPATKDSIRGFLTESTPEFNFKEKTCSKSILALI